MRSLILASIISIFLLSCSESKNPSNQPAENLEISAYDSAFAKRVGADDYGMRKFVIAFLKKGPNRDQDSVTRAEIQRAHLDNMTKMAEAGKMVLAGPFLDGGEYQGIYIFAVESIEEAQELTNSDPAVQAGRLEMELKEWYASAALMTILENHKKIAKEDI